METVLPVHSSLMEYLIGNSDVRIDDIFSSMIESEDAMRKRGIPLTWYDPKCDLSSIDTEVKVFGPTKYFSRRYQKSFGENTKHYWKLSSYEIGSDTMVSVFMWNFVERNGKVITYPRIVSQMSTYHEIDKRVYQTTFEIKGLEKTPVGMLRSENITKIYLCPVFLDDLCSAEEYESLRSTRYHRCLGNSDIEILRELINELEIKNTEEYFYSNRPKS